MEDQEHAVSGGSPGRPRGVKAEETRQRILDAAEKLFSENSFNGVTIRQVANLSGVNTALLHYYFVNKRGLFESVFERRAAELNSERMAALEAYSRSTEKPTVKGAMSAFLGPILERAASGEVFWKTYFALIAQVSNTPELGGDMMSRHFDPVIQRLLDVIQQALPNADRENLYWCYQLFSGSIMLTLSQNGRVDRLSDGLCRSDDLAAIFDRLIPYSAAGFAAVCEDTVE
ncbi:MAG: TetR family transcriptional regulator [Agarilytica sp.]